MVSGDREMDRQSVKEKGGREFTFLYCGYVSTLGEHLSFMVTEQILLTVSIIFIYNCVHKYLRAAVPC